jgi:aryl-alcohol dehydrogenase-like predicted oxidoreductase
MATSASSDMRYALLPGLGRDVSRLILGTVSFRDDTLEPAFALLDRWVELGGNLVDCAHEYGYGSSERALGRWLRDRDARDRLMVLTKGAHPYDGRRRVRADDITADLEDSLERLGVDVVDLLLLHRDDADVPVGPLLETLNEHRAAGRVRAFGASNWSTERLAAAAAYAADHDLEPFTCSSSQLSLAAPNEPAYAGTVSAADAASRAWYARTQLPLLAWSSQAGGFFTDVARGDDEAARRLEHVYGGPANHERRRRAALLGRERGCTTNAIALAWVLHQPFPTFAIVGPRTVAELDSTVEGIGVELSPDEVAWLNLDVEG